MFGNRQNQSADTQAAVSRLSGDLATVRAELVTLRAELVTVRDAMEGARLDYAELAAKAYRFLKGAERARARAEELTQQDDPQLDLVPEIPAGTALRRSKVARAAARDGG